MSAGGAPRAGRVVRARRRGRLFRDDFSGFPPGWLTRPVGQLNAAIQEYHYLPHRGVPLGPWANAICHLDAWAVGEEEGKSYLEQHTVNDQARLMNPIFLTGDPEWEDCTVEVGVRPLSLDDMAGVVFRYHTNRHYYLFALTGGNRARLAVRLPLEDTFRVAKWRELGEAAFPYDTTGVSPPARGEPGREDPRVHRRPPDPLGRGRRAAPGQGRGHREHPRAVPGLPRPASPMRRSVASTPGSPGARRSSPSCAARTRGPSCGSSSPPRSSAPAGTSASATSTATARPRCSSPRTSPGSATTSSRSVA